jgi:hypothetical protein
VLQERAAGARRTVFYEGKPCGFVREYSDTLAIFLLKCHRKGVYGDRPAPAELPNVADVVRAMRQAGDDCERLEAEGKEPPWDDEEGR